MTSRFSSRARPSARTASTWFSRTSSIIAGKGDAALRMDGQNFRRCGVSPSALVFEQKTERLDRICVRSGRIEFVWLQLLFRASFIAEVRVAITTSARFVTV